MNNHNEELIPPFLESFSNVLATMAMMESSAGTPTVKNGQQAAGEVSGIIGLAGNKVRASLAITFPKAVILEIMQRLFGEAQDTIDDQVSDLVGELTNMTTGGAKRLLADAGYDFDMSVPVVVSGANHLVNHQSPGTTIITPIRTENGDIFLEICYETAN
ncbi:MAG: chemotaxis protein CheX [Gammaproteobacteria bacterium]